MNDIIIISASGFAREVAWLIERINKKTPTWNILGYTENDETLIGKRINGYLVLGNDDVLKLYSEVFVICAIGSSRIRSNVVSKIKEKYPTVKFATVIDPSVEMSDFVKIGEGTIICAHTIITVNIEIGNYVIINLDCTIGHDAVIHDFVTLYPSVNVSGATDIGTCSEIGTGMQIIQGKKIGSHSIVGAGAVVVKDIPEKCTAVGSPAKPIKFFE